MIVNHSRKYNQDNISVMYLQFNIAIPVVFLLCVTFLLVVPLYAAPYDTGMGVVCVLSGIPVYLIGVAWKSKPKIIRQYVCEYQSFLHIYFASQCSCNRGGSVLYPVGTWTQDLWIHSPELNHWTKEEFPTGLATWFWACLCSWPPNRYYSVWKRHWPLTL